MIFDRVYKYKAEYWANQAAGLIDSALLECANKKDRVSLFLPAGDTATILYSSLNNFLVNNVESIDFYLVDERLDNISEKFSNRIFVSTQLGGAINSRKNKFYPFPEKKDLYDEKIINTLLPDNPDVILLSLADDGHIASIFRYDESLNQVKDKCFISSSEKHLFQRISITPRYINSAQYIFLLAPGKNKSEHIKISQNRAKNNFLPIHMIREHITITTE